MKSKKRMLVVIALITIIVIGVFGFSLYFKDQTNDHIPNGYIAVFNGGNGEITYSTYIYKIKNEHANYGFKYINTTNMTTAWGSSDRGIKITSRGKVNWTEDVFTIAKKNGAYSYVKLPNDTKTYTIEEFQKKIFNELIKTVL